jgi:Flp pilus assembly protein TadD
VRFQYGDFDAAERLVREAIAALPRSPRPHYLLGLILLARGAAAEAATAFAHTIELDPGYSDAARKLKLAQERASIK